MNFSECITSDRLLGEVYEINLYSIWLLQAQKSGTPDGRTNLLPRNKRFGNYKAQYFAIFDFTQGYYQCPISDDSRAFTAFITIFGLYQWCRVPMGLKSAGSYFQHVMSSLVLSGLMYVMLELYIDDCIIFAKDEDELCERVDKFLSRVVEKNITVNPDKTRIGLPQIEYVGHVLDVYGMHFTQDKLDGVKNFPLPRTPKEL